MNTTKILGKAVEIQSQGTIDNTEAQTKEGLTSALIIGQFMRGRIDKPMTIHQGNIRGQLGHEPTNIDYQAVQDCLDTGVPSVQVLRVGRVIVDPEVPHIISCEGATENIGFFITGNWQIYIDDEIEPYVGEISNALSQLLSSYSGKITGDWDGSMFMQNIDSVPHRFRFVPVENVSHVATTDNPTFMEHEDGSLTFCLNFAVAPVDQDLYTPAILALNPVAYYLMSETVGSVLNDSSLSGYDGEIQETSAITYKADKLRKGSQGSMGFNIASNWTTAQCYVSDAVAGDTFKKLAASGKSFTIAFWFKPIGIRNYNWLATYLINKDFGEANYRLIAYNGNALLGQSPENLSQVLIESYDQMINKVQFVVWRKDNATGRFSLTVNGMTNTAVVNSNDASSDGLGFFFPMSAGYSSYGLRGYMSDMAVFDYALTDAQIANLYQKGRIV